MLEMNLVILLSIGAVIFAAIGMGYVAHSLKKSRVERYHNIDKLSADFVKIMEMISESNGNNGKKETTEKYLSVPENEKPRHQQELSELHSIENSSFLDKLKKYFHISKNA